MEDSFYKIITFPLIVVKREERDPEPMARFTEPPPLKEDATVVEKMRHLFLTMAGRALHAKHTCSVEPVFGIIKIYIQAIQKKGASGGADAPEGELL